MKRGADAMAGCVDVEEADAPSVQHQGAEDVAADLTRRPEQVGRGQALDRRDGPLEQLVLQPGRGRQLGIERQA